MALLSLSGCSDDNDGYSEVDGQVPSIALETEHIRTELGRDFTIAGAIEDKDGLKSIHLKNLDIYLDKVIEMPKDSVVYKFDLAYKFKVAKEIEGDNFPIQIVATDLGGRTTETTVLVSLDGDFTAPSFTLAPDENIAVLVKNQTKLALKFSVSDDKALESVTVKIPEINYEKVLTEFTNSGKTLEFNDPLILPSVVATYNLEIKAVDKFGFEAIKKSVITVSEMPDFAKMYLTDVASADQLNSDIFGIPMLIERTAAYTYKARYYSEKAGTEVRFIPQKTDFAPICFGIDPTNTSVLADDPEESTPIILPAKGYYEITLNVKTGSYSVKAYTPTDTPVAIGTPMFLDKEKSNETIPLEIGLVGAGIPNKEGWNTRDPLILKQDSSNPYLFSVEMMLEANSTIEFIISPKHTEGWWPEPFWRWDRSNDPESNVSNGGENPASWNVKKAGKYMFKFDTHLKRSRFYPIN